MSVLVDAAEVVTSAYVEVQEAAKASKAGGWLGRWRG